MKKTLIIILTILCMLPAAARDINTFLPDGRQVILHDDYTWEFAGSHKPSPFGSWGIGDDAFETMKTLLLAQQMKNGSSDDVAGALLAQMLISKEVFMAIVDISVEIKADYSFIMHANVMGEKEDISGACTIREDELYLLDGTGEETRIGSFSSDYTRLYLEDGDGMFLEKLD